MKVMNKSLSLTTVYTAVGFFLLLNLNIYLFIGFIVGCLARLHSGKIIPLVLGLTIGILFTELIKFVVYKGGFHL